MDSLERIMQKVREKAKAELIGANTNSQQIKSKDMTIQSKNSSTFKCEACSDTSWIMSENGMRRCKCYDLDLIDRRWKKFGVVSKDVKKMNEYVTDTNERKLARSKAVNYVKNFDTIREQRNSSIAFLGQAGTGKTHLALAIGKTLLEKEKHVETIYMPYLEVMRELKANANEDSYYLKEQAKYITCELLIIDDLFKDKVKKGKLCYQLNEADMKHIYPIINQRYINHKATIYNSECSPEMLEELDGALAGRILESCKDNIIIFKYGRENNYRIKDL